MAAIAPFTRARKVSFGPSKVLKENRTFLQKIPKDAHVTTGIELKDVSRNRNENIGTKIIWKVVPLKTVGNAIVDRVRLNPVRKCKSTGDVMFNVARPKCSIKRPIRVKQATPGTIELQKKLHYKKRAVLAIPVPHRVVPQDDEPVQQGDPRFLIHTAMTRGSRHDMDEDAACNDPLLIPVYAPIIYRYLQSVEMEWLLDPEYLKSTNPELTTQMRAIMMDWLIQVQVHLELMQETLHICQALIDQYLHLKQINYHKLQLLGITSLLVAAKFNERFAPDLTADTYSDDDVIKMERRLLSVLDFRINCPTPAMFLDRYVLVAKHKHGVEHLARYLVDLCLTNTRFLHFPASMLAASAIYISRKVFHAEENVWPTSHSYTTKYSEKDLHHCTICMVKQLAKVDITKHQSAKTKYKRPEYHSISTNPLIKDCSFIADVLHSELLK